ncbi:hypothetical protein ACFSCZ_19110, partial [Siminovitchia sediminis]
RQALEKKPVKVFLPSLVFLKRPRAPGARSWTKGKAKGACLGATSAGEKTSEGVFTFIGFFEATSSAWRPQLDKKEKRRAPAAGHQEKKKPPASKFSYSIITPPEYQNGVKEIWGKYIIFRETYEQGNDNCHLAFMTESTDVPNGK